MKLLDRIPLRSPLKHLALAALALAQIGANAATITWGPATDDTLNGSSTAFVQSDVMTNGTFVAAVTNGHPETGLNSVGGGTITVNGVPFTRWTSYLNGITTYGSSPISSRWNTSQQWGMPANAYGTFGYDNGTKIDLLVTGGGTANTTSPGTITLSSLTPGNSYQVQIWAPTWNSTALSLSVAGVPLRVGFPPTTVSQYVVGTFTADGDSQTISWSGKVAPSAISLREYTPAATADADTSTVVANPLTIACDGITTSTITVTLLDASSNPMSGKTVTLASSRGATDTISAASGLSSIFGVVTFTVTSTTAGTPFFTATDTDDSVTVTQTATVDFSAGAVSATQSTVAASPTPILADGTATSTITVTLKAAGGNAVPGKTVTLASSRGALDTIAAASGVSDSSGVVTFAVTSLTPGSSVFTATDTDDNVTVTQTATVDFTVGPVSAAKSTVAASPTAVLADGSTSSTITVTLKDASDHLISGKTVTLESSRGPTDTISDASGASDDFGVVTFAVTSTTPGSPVFTATDTDDSVTVTQTATVTFTVLPATITWGLATDDTLNGDSTAFVQSDVMTNGTFVAAVTNGHPETGLDTVGGGTITVNGVPFTRWTSYSGPPVVDITYGSSPISLRWNNPEQWGMPPNHYGTIGYDNGTKIDLLLTGGGTGSTSTSPGTITLSSLTPAKSYQVQIWAPTWNSNAQTLSVGGVSLRIGNPPGTVSQYVVGTFTANSDSQTISWSGIAPSAISLRDMSGGSAVATATTVTSSKNPSTVGDSVTLTATVTPLPTGGTVQFYDNLVALDSPVAVNPGTGKAELVTSALAVGGHPITANYGGTTGFDPSVGTLTGGQTVLSAYDGWALANAGGGTPSEDANNDGVYNGVAYFMGVTGLATNPGVVAGKVTWPRDPAATITTYEVQVSDNLTSWSAAASGDVDTSDPSKVVYTLSPGAAKKFCRLVVTP